MVLSMLPGLSSTHPNRLAVFFSQLGKTIDRSDRSGDPGDGLGLRRRGLGCHWHRDRSYSRFERVLGERGELTRAL